MAELLIDLKRWKAPLESFLKDGIKRFKKEHPAVRCRRWDFTTPA
jgi:hypothetical protein